MFDRQSIEVAAECSTAGWPSLTRVPPPKSTYDLLPTPFTLDHKINTN